jgi:hypothetical protein
MLTADGGFTSGGPVGCRDLAAAVHREQQNALRLSCRRHCRAVAARPRRRPAASRRLGGQYRDGTSLKVKLESDPCTLFGSIQLSRGHLSPPTDPLSGRRDPNYRPGCLARESGFQWMNLSRDCYRLFQLNPVITDFLACCSCRNCRLSDHAQEGLDDVMRELAELPEDQPLYLYLPVAHL